MVVLLLGLLFFREGDRLTQMLEQQDRLLLIAGLEGQVRESVFLARLYETDMMEVPRADLLERFDDQTALVEKRIREQLGQVSDPEWGDLINLALKKLESYQRQARSTWRLRMAIGGSRLNHGLLADLRKAELRVEGYLGTPRDGTVEPSKWAELTSAYTELLRGQRTFAESLNMADLDELMARLDAFSAGVQSVVDSEKSTVRSDLAGYRELVETLASKTLEYHLAREATRLEFDQIAPALASCETLISERIRQFERDLLAERRHSHWWTGGAFVFALAGLLGLFIWQASQAKRLVAGIWDLNQELDAFHARTLPDRGRPTAGYDGLSSLADTIRLMGQRIQEQLVDIEKERERAAASDRTKSHFLANMSHAIRSPMNGVIGRASLLADTALGPEQENYVRDIRSSGETLLRLIDEILEFSKIVSGRVELEASVFDPRTLVEEVVEGVASQVSEKPVELICSVDNTLPGGLAGDPARLQQVLRVLVDYGIQSTKHGEVCLEVKQAGIEAGRVSLACAVTDSGPGIGPEEGERLLEGFVPFEEGDAGGLGLAICARLVALMDGELRVESELGKGARFSFSIALPIDGDGDLSDTLPASVCRGLLGLPLGLIVRPGHARTALMARLEYLGVRVTLLGDFEQASGAQLPSHVRLWLLDEHVGDSGSDVQKAIDWLIQYDQRRSPLVLLSRVERRLDATGRVVRRATKPIGSGTLADLLFGARYGQKPVTPRPRPVGSLPGARMPVRRARVLVVDDDDTSRRISVDLLLRMQLEVTSAEDGRVGLEKVFNSGFDLVLMDVRMPVMDGLEATRQIRRQETQRSLTIVGVTAGVMPEEVTACREAGMDDVLPKPITVESVEALLGRWLPGVSRASSALGT